MPHSEQAAAMRDLIPNDVNTVLRFVITWLSDVDARVVTLEDQSGVAQGLDARITTLENENLQARVTALEVRSTVVPTISARVDVIEGEHLDTRVSALEHAVPVVPVDLTNRVVAVEQEITVLEQKADLSPRVATLEQEFQGLQSELRTPRHFHITIPNAQRSTTTMATQILDSDKAKVAKVDYTDALGFATTDPGVTVAFASSDATVMTIDAASGAITPVKPGLVQIQATATNADGTAVTGLPADVEILPGAAASFTIAVA